METEQIVTINPDQELRFDPIKNDPTGQLRSSLTITNESKTNNLAYKVKTTAPRHYIVKPNQGILDAGKNIVIDITLVNTPDNKIDDNKFLVQVAPCSLTQSENYALQKFWDTLDKKASLNFKLKVSAPSVLAGSAPPANQSPPQSGLNQSQTVGENTATQSTPLRTTTTTTAQPQNIPKKQEYEKAPDDDINHSLTLQQTSNAPETTSKNQQSDNIKVKVDELKHELDKVELDKQVLRDQIKQLQMNSAPSEKDLHAWQHEPDKISKGFSIVHLLVVALASLVIGHYIVASS